MSVLNELLEYQTVDAELRSARPPRSGASPHRARTYRAV